MSDKPTPDSRVSAPAGSGLSATKLADLPGAAPFQTGLSGDTSVQIASLQVGHVLAKRFRIEEQIGAGGMGAVYRAHDELRDEDIALKVMLPGLLASEEAKRRFMNEAKIAIRLRHHHIVSVHDVQADGAYLFLTMELLQGRTLRAEMEARKKSGLSWSESEVIDILKPLCEALSYAHTQTVHRDIKPENIWIGSDGVVKLMDFGIARVLSGSQLTQTAAVLGTAYYMAPEQLAGSKDLDHRADQYSLGVLMYEMLTGRIPTGRFRSVEEQRPGIGKAISAAVDKALSGERESRYRDIEDFRTALTQISVRQPATESKGIGSKAAVLALVAVLVAGGWYLKDRSDQVRAEAQRVEERRKAEEVRVTEEKRIAEERRLAEEKRIAEQRRKAEETKLVAEKKKAEELQLAQEKKQAEVKGIVVTGVAAGVKWAEADNGADINWNQAKTYCASKGRGWRLPTVAELQANYRSGQSTPCGQVTCKISSGSRLTAPWFWSNEIKDSSAAWSVGLYFGSRSATHVEDHGTLRALCVRRL